MTSISLLENLDIFRTGFTFSNQTSTWFSKFFTFSYLALFIYFTASSVILIYFNNKIVVTNVTTFDKNINTSDTTFYKQMNIIFYIQLYANDGSVLTEKSTTELLSQYMSFKLSSYNSNFPNYFYKSNALEPNRCGGSGNMIVYCLTHSINSIHDHLAITLNKPILIDTDEFNNFINTYTMRFHIDYYFSKSNCNVKEIFFKTGDIFNYLLGNNQVFFDNGIFDYVKNTYNSFDLKFNKSMLYTNYQLNLNRLNLELDSGVFLSSRYEFRSFQFESIVVGETSNVLSFVFKVVPLLQSYYFRYSKIQTSLAEMAGLLNVFKFIGMFIVIIMNYIKQHNCLASKFYNKNIIMKEDMCSYLHNKNKSEMRILTPQNETNIRLNLNNVAGDINKPVRKTSRLKFKTDKHPFGDNPHDLVFTLTHKFNIKKTSKRNVIPGNSEKDNFGKYISEHMKDGGSFSDLSMISLLCWGKCFRRRRYEFNIFLDMIKENLRKMDFMYIMEKINQVNILTYLLLDDSQKEVMRYIQKDQIYYDNVDNKTYIVNKCEKRLTEDLRVEALSMYFSRVRGNNLTDVDKKLMGLIDEKLLICAKLDG
jgi:hypothetical protein